MKFVSRAYNTFKVNSLTNASVIKTSEEARLLGEIEYYESLPKELQVYFPRMFESVKHPPYSMELEYYAYSNLGMKMLNSEFVDSIFWEKTFQFMFDYFGIYQQHTKVEATDQDSKLMFIDKTINEYKNLVTKFDYFKGFDDEKEFVLNGKVIQPFSVVWKRIEKFLLSSFEKEFYYIHGDFCFSNILYGVNEQNNDVILKYIDPRGIFGNKSFYGDACYDLAKLSHSCNGGYEYFIYDKFKVTSDNNIYTLDYYNDNKKQIYEIFSKFVPDSVLLKMKTLEGLIFVGMCARHYDSLERQKAMIMTGLNILNEVYDEI